MITKQDGIAAAVAAVVSEAKADLSLSQESKASSMIASNPTQAAPADSREKGLEGRYIKVQPNFINIMHLF